MLKYCLFSLYLLRINIIFRYNRIWEYAWANFVDHTYGAWYRILTNNNMKYNNEKSPAGKTDYHTMGACYEILNIIQLTSVKE